VNVTLRQAFGLGLPDPGPNPVLHVLDRLGADRKFDEIECHENGATALRGRTRL
jgi:hypothetical protein